MLQLYISYNEFHELSCGCYLNTSIPTIVPLLIFKIISFFIKKFLLNSKKFWLQKFLKMGIGDYSQKWGSGISLGIWLIKEGSPNPQLVLVFF